MGIRVTLGADGIRPWGEVVPPCRGRVGAEAVRDAFQRQATRACEKAFCAATLTFA